jgi:carboxypeptidase T
MLQAIIKANTAAKLRQLRRFHIDLKDHSARYDQSTSQYEVAAIISSEQKQQLESAGYSVEVISDLREIAKARLDEVSKVNRFTEAHGMSEFQRFTVYGGYMNVDEIETALIKLHDAYPEIVTLIELPNKTWENRTSRAIRLRKGTNSNRPGVLFTGGIHAREWGTSDICYNFIINLLNSFLSNTELKYGNKTFSSEQIQAILNKLDIFVFPDVNPDGKAYSQATDRPDQPGVDEGIWWRKNRNPKQVIGGPYEYHNTGVDINRNFGFLWQSGIGTEENGKPIPETFRGEAPFSEPESNNVKSLFDTYTNIKYFVDIHCHAGKILMSWGDDDYQCIYPEQNFRNAAYDGLRGILCGDEQDGKAQPDFIYREYIHPLDLQILADLGTTMGNALTEVRGREYMIEQAVGLYPTTGSSQDYAFSRNVTSNKDRSKTYAFTIEFGSPQKGHPENIFIPSYSVMQNIIADICSAITALCVAVSTKV